MLERARGSVALPFTIVRKGYAPDEVRMYFDRFDEELRRVAEERDAARAELAAARRSSNPADPSNNEGFNLIRELRSEIDHLSAC
ncbi:hypothetical protein [Nocardia carnea]|nr:hypothetical protein [Nocardia carnea]